jgi:hypothetical protein
LTISNVWFLIVYLRDVGLDVVVIVMGGFAVAPASVDEIPMVLGLSA